MTFLLKFGGTTNAFPAIKRNGAQIDFRLADDSAFCNIQANNATLNRVLIDLAGVAFQGATNTNLTPSSNGWTLGVNAATNSFHFGRTGSFDTRQATAMVQIDSTTQGFLPPRMTTTQKNAIFSWILPLGRSTSLNSPGMIGVSSPLILIPRVFKPPGKLANVPASIN